MSGAWGFLGAIGSSLLRSSCTWYRWTAEQEQPDGDVEQTYSSDAVTLACNVGRPSKSWRTTWPDSELADSFEFWLDATRSELPGFRDRIVFNNEVYEVKDTSDWDGAGYAVLADRIGGVK